MRATIALRNVLLALVVVISVVIAMGGQHANEDLYMALCSGRDTAHGLLAAPDYWSYATDGEVWLNQGWAAGLIFYLAYVIFGALGTVLIKGVLLALTLAVCLLKCRRMGVTTGACLCALAMGALSMAPLLSIIAENFGVFYLILLSSLLTMPVSYGRVRKWGCLLVMLLWSNSHGSFMIGWAMIWIKVAAVVLNALLRGYGPAFFERASKVDRIAAGLSNEANPGLQILGARDYVGEIRGWIWVAVGSLIIMAFANPYGVDNLMMPFQQSASGAWTKDVLFWFPLIGFSSSKGLVLYKGLSSAPFLIYLLICASLVCFVLFVRRNEIDMAILKSPQSKLDEDLLAEVMNTLFLVVLTFRFGRTIVFTAPALIPLAGYLLWKSTSLVRESRLRWVVSSELIAAVLTFVATGLLAGYATLWFRYEIVPTYLPSNSLVRAQPLSEKILGSFATGVKGLVEFLRMNNISGRICSSWQLADVLLWEVPRVTIFLDLRAQSLYSDELFEEYKRIFRVAPDSPSSVSKALELLDSRHVRAVAIDKRLETSRLPVVLSRSRRWIPIYHDDVSLLYVRSDSHEAACSLNGDHTNCVRYPDSASRALSQATLWLESGRQLPKEIEEKLRASVVSHPSALAYRAMCIAERRRLGSLTPETLAYLWSEHLRLEKSNYSRPAGFAILAARAQILEELKRSGYFSVSVQSEVEYAKLRKILSGEIHGTYLSYLPWTKSRLDLAPKK